MRFGYLQPTSGIAGNMLIGACLDAGLEWSRLEALLRPLAIGDWEVTRERVIRGGLSGTYFDTLVDDPSYQAHDHHHHDDGAHDHHHHGPHRHYPEIIAIVEGASHLSATVRDRALKALALIGDVESRLHQVPLHELHLHEIGALDTILDVVGGFAALELLGIEQVFADPVHCGSGTIQTDHGIVPNPSPATLEVLRGIPLIAEAIPIEFTTPTGAAMLATLLTECGTVGAAPPPCRVVAVGYGAGKKAFSDRPNLLRLTIGETLASDRDAWQVEQVSVLTANIDDASPERFPPLIAALLEAGALDATLTPLVMKGGRPGVRLEVICHPEIADRLRRLVFGEGLTLGIRAETIQRAVLARRSETVTLADGQRIDIKIGLMEGREVSRKPEMRQVEAAAKQRGVSVQEILEEVSRTRAAEGGELPGWATRS